MLIIYFCVTKYPKTKWFKTTFYYVCWSGIWTWLSWILWLRVFQNPKNKNLWTKLLSCQGLTGAGSIPKPTHMVVGRILFLSTWAFSQGSSQYNSLYHQSEQERKWTRQKFWSFVTLSKKCNPMTFAIFYLRSKSLGLATLRRRLYKDVNTRHRNHQQPFQKLPIITHGV